MINPTGLFAAAIKKIKKESTDPCQPSAKWDVECNICSPMGVWICSIFYELSQARDTVYMLYDNGRCKWVAMYKQRLR